MFSQEQVHKAGFSSLTKTLDIKTSYTTKNIGILGCHSENRNKKYFKKLSNADYSSSQRTTFLLGKHSYFVLIKKQHFKDSFFPARNN